VKRAPSLVCLSREHHDGLVIALRITREAPDAGDEAFAGLYQDFLAFWEEGLLRHFRAENECLLARLVRHVGFGDALVTRTQSDHLKMEALVAQMRDTADAPARRQALREVADVLREHIRWEEERLFEVTQQQLSAEEMAALGEDLEQRLPPLCFPFLFGDERKKRA
jgi:hemerythrin-like domain-containing protein